MGAALLSAPIFSCSKIFLKYPLTISGFQFDVLSAVQIQTQNQLIKIPQNKYIAPMMITGIIKRLIPISTAPKDFFPFILQMIP